MDDSSGKEHNQIVIAKSYQAKVARHTERDQRHGKDQANDESPLLAVDFLRASLSFDILDGVGFTYLNQIETAFTDDLSKLSNAGNARDIFDQGAFSAKTHIDREHTILLRKQFLERNGVRVILQTSNRQLSFARSNAVTNAHDFRDDAAFIEQGRVESNGKFLTGQVHVGNAYAWQFANIPLDCGGTVSAGHTGNRHCHVLHVRHPSPIFILI